MMAMTTKSSMRVNALVWDEECVVFIIRIVYPPPAGVVQYSTGVEDLLYMRTRNVRDE